MSSLTESTSGSASKEGNASSKHEVGEGAEEVEDPITVALERLAMLPVSDAHIEERTEIISTLSHFFGKKVTENMTQRCAMATLRKTVDTLSDKLEDMKLSCMSGIGRFQLTNADWHKKYPHACKEIFLFDDFDEMKAYFEAFWPDIFGPNIEDSKRFGTSRARNALTDFERCLITLMRLNMRYMRYSDLALIWDTSKKTVARCLKEWAPRLRKNWKSAVYTGCPRRIFERILPTKLFRR